MLLSSFALSGCFEIFRDITVKPDGTCLFRQTIGIRKELFDELSGLGSMEGDTTKFLRQAVVDSFKYYFSHKRDSLTGPDGILGKCGISDVNIYDTTVDSMPYFSFETTIANIDSLPGAAHLMSNAVKVPRPEETADGSDEIQIFVKHAKNKTIVTYHSTQKDDASANIDIPGLEDLVKGLSMHYRVFSPALERPIDKHIKIIPGGQERVFGAEDLMKKGKNAHLDATFVIRSARSPNKPH